MFRLPSIESLAVSHDGDAFDLALTLASFLLGAGYDACVAVGTAPEWVTLKQDDRSNYSSPSPVTDGQHVWVMTGLGVLKAFDFDGKESATVIDSRGGCRLPRNGLPDGHLVNFWTHAVPGLDIGVIAA